MVPPAVMAAGHFTATLPPDFLVAVVFLADFLAAGWVPCVPAARVTPKPMKTTGTTRIGIRYRFMEKVLSEAAIDKFRGR
jgi:hypothetical protein